MPSTPRALAAAPVLSNVTAQAGVFGTPRSLTVSGEFSDADAGDTFTLTIDWGAGAPPQPPQQIPAGVGSRPFQFTNTYDSVGPKSIVVTVTDSTGSSDSETAQYTIPSPGVIRINSVVSPCFSGSCSEAEGSDLLVQIMREGDNDGATTVQLQLGGDATEGETGDFFVRAVEGSGPRLSPPLTISFEDGEPGVTQLVERFIRIQDDTLTESNETITLTLSNPTGGATIDPTRGSASVTITDNDAPPSLSLANVQVTPEVQENGTVTLQGSLQNASGAVGLSINWGSGEGSPQVVSVPAGESTFSVTHQYRDDNPTDTTLDLYTISVTATDASNAVANASATTTVRNVEPQLTNITFSPRDGFPAEGAYVLRATVVDPGTKDTFTLNIDWDDGDQVVTFPAGTTAIEVERFYTAPGNKDIEVEIQDDDRGDNSYLGIPPITIGAANLKIEVPSSAPFPTTAVVGDQLEFELRLTNLGPDPATRTSVAIIVPEELEPTAPVWKFAHTPSIVTSCSAFQPAGENKQAICTVDRTLEVGVDKQAILKFGARAVTSGGARVQAAARAVELDQDRSNNEFSGNMQVSSPLSCAAPKPKFTVKLRKGTPNTYDLKVDPKSFKAPCSFARVRIDWGDGGPQVSQTSLTASHDYAPGERKVRIWLTDNGGHVDVEAEKKLKVKAPKPGR